MIWCGKTPLTKVYTGLIGVIFNEVRSAVRCMAEYRIDDWCAASYLPRRCEFVRANGLRVLAGVAGYSAFLYGKMMTVYS